MRSYKGLIIMATLICIISLLLSIFYNFNIINLESNKDYFTYLFLGIFTSSFVVLLSSAISYKVVKSEGLSNLLSTLGKTQELFFTIEKDKFENDEIKLNRIIISTTEYKNFYDNYISCIFRYSPFNARKGLKQDLLNLSFKLGSYKNELIMISGSCQSLSNKDDKIITDFYNRLVDIIPYAELSNLLNKVAEEAFNKERYKFFQENTEQLEKLHQISLNSKEKAQQMMKEYAERLEKEKNKKK